ncbi:uncharacterized protein TRIADDRAFT_22473 [Trichoplax adhaerens]|uniref:Glycoside hydrolase family 31 N-terminal domain-containing protein n=1 Tax=Trichoplax adhaerens TaxID=10228 RepID=B3RS98_TRIAD|nr:hypothetical protein TRIADDRAFT_22473 [Trichoplax adhaerens]EDV26478.1 hypothetical protein TRIADDRAFT_22473 [Trichoplax adhaerens]|eukprot:XP_002110474.1 hypothetical protein TRIADDRAFT_22473 [Trichoplax adhaerens]
MSKISEDCTSFTWQPTSNQWTSLCDCFRLDRGYWYSGSEMHEQFWPLKDAEIPSQPYISSYKLISYGSVLEKMWFNSNGLIVIANQTKQLSVQVTKNNLCLQSYATNHALQYQVCSHHDLKNVYQIYAKRLFELPTTAKDDDLFRTIIWTMSNQHMSINQSMVEYYADQIVRYQFNQSIIELGDDYSTAHGDFDFDQNRFPNVSKTIFQLHQWGLKISLSVSVIASINSQTFQQGIENNYWVRRKDKYSQDVLAIIKWSRGNGVLLDVTNPQARRWFTSRLIKFQHDYHIDYFNFLHGEADYLPADMVTFGTLDDPNHYTRLFNKMVSDIASVSFVEAAYQAQQLNPIIQMQRKDSSWSNVTGLPSIIPSAITLGLIGYPLFTPATINNFDFTTLSTKLDRDLYIRWIQLSSYLPILKLSTGPWNFDVQAIAFLQKLIQFRRQFLVPKFIQINQQLTSTGLPIVRPIWWLAPKDTTAQNIFDEFLIGDDILVAPIVQKKTNSRKIYLPRGYWFDAISKTNFSVAVGRWLTNYVTQYTQVAYFIYSPWK